MFSSLRGPQYISRRMRKMSPLIVLLLHLSAVYSGSHTLRYYSTVVSARGSGLPEYSEVGYVDDQEIVNYNSESGEYRARVQWMERQEPQYWETQTQIAKGNEAVSRHDVKTAMSRFNQTAGFHIVQRMYGCTLGDDGSITGYEQHGYDGREFLFLDTETWTYIPMMPQAQITTQRWNSPEVQVGQRNKNYVENICIEWLQKYVENGREDLERKVQPTVKVSGQETGGIVTLHCQVYGFHPKIVDVKWRKNKVDDIHAFQTTHVLPNPDGTYYIRVSAEVMPEDGVTYSCYVEHDSLREALNVVWEPKNPNTWVIPVVIAAVVIILLAGIAGIILYKKKKAGYTTTSTSDTSSDVSNNAPKA